MNGDGKRERRRSSVDENCKLTPEFLETVRTCLFSLVRLTALTNTLREMDPFSIRLFTMIVVISENLRYAITSLNLDSTEEGKTTLLLFRSNHVRTRYGGSQAFAIVGRKRLQEGATNARTTMASFKMSAFPANRKALERVKDVEEMLLTELRQTGENKRLQLRFYAKEFGKLVDEGMDVVRRYHESGFGLVFDVSSCAGQEYVHDGTLHLFYIMDKMRDLARAVEEFNNHVDVRSVKNFAPSDRKYFGVLANVLATTAVSKISPSAQGFLFRYVETHGRTERVHAKLAVEDELRRFLSLDLRPGESMEEDEEYSDDSEFYVELVSDDEDQWKRSG